jgi:hypothetical protein
VIQPLDNNILDLIVVFNIQTLNFNKYRNFLKFFLFFLPFFVVPVPGLNSGLYAC